jgi:U3 small nucleolar RNA-associated protein 4
VWGLAVSPDAETIAAACDDGCIRLFDISEGNLHYKKTFPKTDGTNL